LTQLFKALLERLAVEVFDYVLVHGALLYRTVDLADRLTFASRLYRVDAELVI
jgi:hypothetical protein